MVVVEWSLGRALRQVQLPTEAIAKLLEVPLINP